jgi:hypothetical protein
MKYLPISLGIAATALFLYAAAQTINTTPSLNQIMTPDDQQKTGIDKLTPDERAQLEIWIQTYTQSKVASLQQKTTKAKKASMKPSFGVLTINVRGGQFLILMDSSVWEVAPDDIFTSSAWLSSIALEITYDTSDPNAYFPFIIKNQYSGLTVHARQASMDDIPDSTQPSNNGANPDSGTPATGGDGSDTSSDDTTDQDTSDTQDSGPTFSNPPPPPRSDPVPNRQQQVTPNLHTPPPPSPKV